MVGLKTQLHSHCTLPDIKEKQHCTDRDSRVNQRERLTEEQVTEAQNEISFEIEEVKFRLRSYRYQDTNLPFSSVQSKVFVSWTLRYTRNANLLNTLQVIITDSELECEYNPN